MTTLVRVWLRFFNSAGAVFGICFLRVGRGGSGETRTVLLLDDALLSAETCLDWALLDPGAGRMVLELSSDTFPADNFGGDNFRGDSGVFFGDNGGSGGMLGSVVLDVVVDVCGE